MPLDPPLLRLLANARSQHLNRSLDVEKFFLLPFQMQADSSASFPESITNPATYTSVTTISDRDKVLAAKTYLNDPILLSQLTDRVYQLLLTDLKYQQERTRSYCRRI